MHRTVRLHVAKTGSVTWLDWYDRPGQHQTDVRHSSEWVISGHMWRLGAHRRCLPSKLVLVYGGFTNEPDVGPNLYVAFGLTGMLA